MNKRSIVRVTIVVSVLALAIWLIARSVDFNAMFDIVNGSNIWLLLASVPAILISHVIRAHRWNWLLSEEPTIPPITRSFSAVMIGYAANTLVPRSGELLRPFVLSQRTKVTFATALSSVVVERILDVFTLLAAIVAILLWNAEPIVAAIPTFDPTMVVSSFAIPTVLLLVVLVFLTFTDAAPAMISGLVGRFSPSIAERLRSMFADVRKGAAVLRRPRTWPIILVDTVVIWFLWVIALWLVLIAMPWKGSSFSLLDGAILLVVTAIGVTIAPTPGALGVYQGFAQVALMRMYGATANEGLAFGILAWVINYGVALIVGGIAFMIESRHGISWKQRPNDQSGESIPS